MSGGSWNYLCYKDIDELMNGSSTELLQDMADRLNSAGFEDVAKDTQRLVEYIKSASIRIETLFEALSPVFKAIEWFDSGDWGEETLNNEILKYRNVRPDSYNKAIDDCEKLQKKVGELKRINESIGRKLEDKKTSCKMNSGKSFCFNCANSYKYKTYWGTTEIEKCGCLLDVSCEKFERKD